MTDQIHRIADKEPEFPCWIFINGLDFREGFWLRYEHTRPVAVPCTHWSPDSPTAPKVRPYRYSPFEEPLEYHASIAGGKHDDDIPPASTPSPAAIAAAREIHPEYSDEWVRDWQSHANARKYSPESIVEFEKLNREANEERSRIAAIIDKHFAEAARQKAYIDSLRPHNCKGDGSLTQP